jgi:hypothetical protein
MTKVAVNGPWVALISLDYLWRPYQKNHLRGRWLFIELMAEVRQTQGAPIAITFPSVQND